MVQWHSPNVHTQVEIKYLTLCLLDRTLLCIVMGLRPVIVMAGYCAPEIFIRIAYSEYVFIIF